MWLYEQIGREIKRARELHGLTQSELADRVGVTRTSISNLESGRQRVPIDTLFSICDVLGTEPRDILPTVEEARRMQRGYNVEDIRENFDQQSADWIFKLISRDKKEG